MHRDPCSQGTRGHDRPGLRSGPVVIPERGGSYRPAAATRNTSDQVGAQSWLEPVDVVLTNAPGELDRRVELLEHTHATRAERQVRVDASDLGRGQRALEVVGDDLDEHIARDVSLLRRTHDDITPSK